MKTILNAIFKFIAFILAGILVLSLPIALLLNNLGEVIFDEEEINGIATDVIVNSDIVPAVLEFVTNQQADEISTKIEDTERPEGRGLNLYNLMRVFAPVLHKWSIDYQSARLKKRQSTFL